MLRIQIGMEPHYFWGPDPGVSKLGPDPNLNIRENIIECGEQIVNMKINIIFFWTKRRRSMLPEISIIRCRHLWS